MGYAFSSLDELGDGVFRKIRPGLGITAFGANALVLAPGIVFSAAVGALVLAVLVSQVRAAD